MALCHITGTLFIPDGSEAANRRIQFQKLATDVVTDDYAGAVVPEVIPTKTDANGDVDVYLVTGYYVGTVLDRRGNRSYTFKATVPDQATANLSDLINSAIPVEPIPAWLQEAWAARDAAEAGADRAEVASSDAEGFADAAADSAEDAQDSADAAGDSAADAAALLVNGDLTQGALTIGTRNSVEALTISPDVNTIQTDGYAVSGDGGAALYRRVATEPSHAGKVQSVDGAWWELTGTRHYTEVFGGGAGKLPAQNSAAIFDAMRFLNGAGGGALVFRDGTHLVSSEVGQAAVGMLSGVGIVGESLSATIKLSDAADGHLINIPDGTENVSITSITLDGNRVNQVLGGVHCVRVAGVVGFNLSNAIIKNASRYGVGIQRGVNKNVYITDCTFEGSGGDAIDIKSSETANPGGALNSGVFINNVRVTSFGVDSTITTETVQAAIDIRGPVVISNVSIAGVGNRKIGIRFRFGEAGEINGSGGHDSVLNNALIWSDGTGLGTGISIEARQVTVTNARVYGVEIGIAAFQNNSDINAIISNCSTGLHVYNAGGTIPSDGSRGRFSGSITSCSAYGANLNAVTGFIINAAHIRGNGVGVRMTGNQNIVTSSHFSNNTTAIDDTGVGNVKANNFGT